MTTTLNFKPQLDLPLWRHNAPGLVADAAGCSLAWDMRNDVSRVTGIYHFRGTANLELYNPITDDWETAGNPGSSAVAAGATAIFHPSAGPRGVLAAGNTTTTVVLSTALPATVGAHVLADGGGNRIRIIGKSAGGSGLINERNIILNTAGTAPTLTLDVPLSFTPAAGDAYEILSGKVYMLGSGVLAAGTWKSFDVATGFVATLNNVNLPATISTDSTAIALSELHVSCDRVSGSGFVNGGASYDAGGTGLNGALATAKNCILATAATATTITGSAMPADLQANEYTNFQVRIVEDTVNPTAVGQRSKIASHTAGATGVFTVAAFGVTPSASAKFVVENNDDQILLRSSATTSVYTYSISGDAWNAATFNASGSAVGAGLVMEQCFGIVRDPTHQRRHSHIFCIRGGNVAAIDMLDIAAAAAGTWTNAMSYYNNIQTWTTGSCGAYDPITMGGKFLHLCINGTQRMARFNMMNTTMETGTFVRYTASTAVTGSKLAFGYMLDGATKLGLLFQRMQSAQVFVSNLIQS